MVEGRKPCLFLRFVAQCFVRQLGQYTGLFTLGSHRYLQRQQISFAIPRT